MATVHILATVRKPKLLDAATLVFRTLRTGFPEGRVEVTGNGLDVPTSMAISQAAGAVGAGFINYAATSHDAWIEGLIERETAPFWICDTDVVFWSRAPQAMSGSVVFAGAFEPEFEEEWTQTTHVERLHTALMWINPVGVRMAMHAWMARVPAPWGRTAQFPLVRQHFLPVRGRGRSSGKVLFYDTMAGLWQAGMGTAFTQEEEECFEHLHCATYVDVVTAPSLKGLATRHQQIFENVQAARGLRAEQRMYYERRAKKGTA